jgi:hypothetical protein
MAKESNIDALVTDDSVSVDTSFEGDSIVNATPKEQEVIAKDEDRAVFRLRLLVLAVLIASTVGVAFAVYNYISSSEQNEFERQVSIQPWYSHPGTRNCDL